MDLTELLATRPYPGRGCIAARTNDGELSFLYFLSGRSAASRNRRIEVSSSGDVAVVGVDVGQDALRHYVAAARRGDWFVIGNGDQVEPLVSSLAAGVSPSDAAAMHTFEPDPPIFTQRIWLATRLTADAPTVLFGFAQSADEAGTATNHLTLSVGAIATGRAVVMTTYDGTADHPRTTAFPAHVTVDSADRRDLLNDLWNTLDPDVRVAAFAVDPFDAVATFVAVP